MKLVDDSETTLDLLFEILMMYQHYSSFKGNKDAQTLDDKNVEHYIPDVIKKMNEEVLKTQKNLQNSNNKLEKLRNADNLKDTLLM